MFRRRLHAINVFIWPAHGATSPPASASGNGFNAQGWTQGGLNFLAVSEIPAADLDKFVSEYQDPDAVAAYPRFFAARG